jgi:hypothetical protein
MRHQLAVLHGATCAVLALNGHALAEDWTVPPPYTFRAPPTTPRDGTVAATADNTNQATVYGPAVSFARSIGASYGGIGTTVMGTTTAVAGTTTPVIGTGRPYFGSSAWIRAGKASGATSVSMEWRTATQGELYGSSADNPGPLPDSGPWNTLGSDVLHLSGIAPTGSLDSQGRLPTDAYTLELTFDPDIIVAGYQNFDTYGWTLQDIISHGELQLGYKDPITGVWGKELNVIQAGTSRIQNVSGSWASFAAANLVTDDNLSTFVGSWGIQLDTTDPTNSRIWAVVDHTSMFAVVPAPGAIALLCMGAPFGARRRRS